MKLRILIVEDNEDQLKGIMRDIEMIPPKYRRELGIDRFHFDRASCGEEATAFLEAAVSPYDILLLDMSFPFRKEETASPGNGGELLQFARDRRAAKEIIIVSVFSDYVTTISAFRSGAVDLVAKPYLSGMLQARVVESWKRVLEKDTASLLEERIKELVPYAEYGFAYPFNARFLDLVNLMFISVANLEAHAHGHYGLSIETHANDYFIRCLLDQREALNRAKTDWRNLQSILLASRSKKSEIVESLLYGIYQTVQPCLFTKRVKLKIPKTRSVRVQTFQDDVQAVLKEIIVGALSEPTARAPVNNQIKIDVRVSDGRAKVCFVDDLPSMDADDVRRINDGARVAPDQHFRRAWGLSIMQNIAMYGGGRLEVESRNGRGNIITYLLPLADS